ncbi:Phosphatidyl-N-methylethanolamine N-methyltransferase [Knufia obscura]|uniref:Phosphatidyl-N-methylethanolamine N-methyltransferase n=1 Tax=Knufia obscura TaxID=1635080 RepID=A0ABR0RC36_9EURO|nr:Phosphatidyl-N-methylethanolamine N-methyltransferase [Knufia obscura]
MEKPSFIMEKVHNLIAGATGGEKIGFIDTSKESLYSNIQSSLLEHQYKTHFLTKVFGSPYRGCYFLAITIFSLGIIRDYFYTEALAEQPFYPPLYHPYVGIALLAIGNTLVLTSMYALGVTGTYLGDYFGILMDEKVEGFPFNVTGAPMYWGSACSFLGTALYKGKAAGVILTVQVVFMYLIALQFEDPFTAEIYAKRDRERAAKGTDSKKKA